MHRERASAQQTGLLPWAEQPKPTHTRWPTPAARAGFHASPPHSCRACSDARVLRMLTSRRSSVALSRFHPGYSTEARCVRFTTYGNT